MITKPRGARAATALTEQADFDQGLHDPSKLHALDAKPGTGEFSDRGRADLKIRPNDPRFADNPLANYALLDEFAEGSSEIDRLHQMLTKAGVSDQQIRGGISLTQGGKIKVAARLGIGPHDVEMYLNSLAQQVRDTDADDMEAALAEQYYNAVNTIDEADVDHRHGKDRQTVQRQIKRAEAGRSERPFELAEDRYSYEQDALGSVTIRDAITGRSAFIQGARAARLLSQLKSRTADQDGLLAPLIEGLEDAPVADFWDEIEAQAGSYNFQWKRPDQHGTGTVLFQTKGQPTLRLVDVRDAEGNEIAADHAMRQDLLQQARDFIGKE